MSENEANTANGLKQPGGKKRLSLIELQKKRLGMVDMPEADFEVASQQVLSTANSNSDTQARNMIESQAARIKELENKMMEKQAQKIIELEEEIQKLKAKKVANFDEVEGEKYDPSQRMETDAPLKTKDGFEKEEEEDEDSQDNPFRKRALTKQKSFAEQADELESQLKEEGACGKNCNWITASLIAGFLLGAGQYLYASNYAQYGMSATGIMGPGTLVPFTIIKVAREIYFRSKTGRWTKPVLSSWYDSETKKIKWISVVPIAIIAITNILTFILLTYAWDFAVQAGLNQGVITTLMNLISPFDCVLFFCAFGESISKVNILGVIFMFAGVTCIGFAAASGDDSDIADDIDTGGRSRVTNGIFALSVGIGAPIMVSFQHWGIRKFSKSYTGLQQAFDSAVVQNVLMCFFLIQLSTQMDIKMKDLLIGGLAGCSVETGRVLIAYSIVAGPAGPISAILSMAAIYQALAGVFFADQSMDALQIGGILLGLLGVFAISLFDTFVNKFQLKRQLTRMRTLESQELERKASSASNKI